MTPAAKMTVRLALILALSLQVQLASSQDAVQIAEEEAVRRQEATIRLRAKLDEAQSALKRNQEVESARLYQEAVGLIPLVEVGNPVVDAEKREAVAGLDGIRIDLARKAMEQGDLINADTQISSALAVDPSNETLLRFKADINKRAIEQRGNIPSPDMVKTIPNHEKDVVETATMVQNAKLLYEMGKYGESEAILKKVLLRDPSNRQAPYYLDLIKEANFANSARAREGSAKTQMGIVEQAWILPTQREALQVPNPMARTNLVYTSAGRQRIISKLSSIRLSEINYDLPLSEVLKIVRDESKKRDPEGVGINFLINGHYDASSGAISPTDTSGAAAAGAAAVAPPAPAVDISGSQIKIVPALNDLSLADVLDAITKVSDTPIKYTIEDYAVVFSPKLPEMAALYTRTFRVDPNTFVQGLENVSSVSLGSLSSSGHGGGGGSTTGLSIDIPRVSVAGGTGTAQQGGGAAQGGAGSRIGLTYVTRTNNTELVDEMVKQYFTAAGVNLTEPGKSVFFNDRNGMLMVRASIQDLETIQQAVEVLNQTPPQLTIETKFAEISQEDSRALGFNWYLGNSTINNGAIGFQGGTAPSFQGPSTAANPSGIFPGAGGPGTVSQSASDGNFTSGLSQLVGPANNQETIPTVATITGILTEPQFRVAINAIEQRTGSDVLSSPRVTTLSGRQTHVAVLDLQEIVTGVDLSQLASASTGSLTGGGTGAIASEVTYTTQSMPFGPVLDVMPTVSADGFSIQMVLIPTLTEFVGYDNPGAFVPQAQSVGGSNIGIPLTAVLPLPHLQMRQVVTSCNVWDGQTVVLGGLISEHVTKLKSKVPVLGDLPLLGPLFQSQSTDSQKQNLMIFVTPTLIDPAGNRLHTDEEMPFARTSIPAQPAAQ